MPVLYVGAVVTDSRRQPQALQVVRRDHRDAGEHPDVDVGDPVNAEHGVDEDDAVWDCVFLPSGDDDRVSGPRKTYAFPESVLSRYRVEAAQGDLARQLRTQIVEEFVAGVLATADSADGDSVGQVVRDMIVAANGRVETEVPTEVILEEAEELAEAASGPGGESA